MKQSSTEIIKYLYSGPGMGPLDDLLNDERWSRKRVLRLRGSQYEAPRRPVEFGEYESHNARKIGIRSANVFVVVLKLNEPAKMLIRQTRTKYRWNSYILFIKIFGIHSAYLKGCLYDIDTFDIRSL